MSKKKYRICEVCQQKQYLSEEQIITGLQQNAIQQYAYILHDKDVYTHADEDENPLHKAGTLKPEHWHVMIKFNAGDSRSLQSVASWFGIDEQYVNKSKYGNFNAMLLYLIHHKKFEKFQYCATAVQANFDYVTFLEQQNLKLELKEIIQLIEQGIMKRYNYENYVSCETFIKCRSQIESAFKYFEDKNQTCNRNMEVIFISGASGSGKTTLAKDLAQRKNLTPYITDSGKDSMSSYRGETCIIFDDIRSNSMDFTDLLKMLDNHTATRVGSRYANKDISDCALIILTSVFNIDQMFKAQCIGSNEPLEQMKRRCKTWINIKDDKIDYYSYSGQVKDYVLVAQTTLAISGVPEDALQPRSLEDLEELLQISLTSPQVKEDDDPEKDSGDIICPF